METNAVLIGANVSVEMIRLVTIMKPIVASHPMLLVKELMELIM